MFNIQIKSLISFLLISGFLFIVNTNNLKAQKYYVGQKILLPSCDINITADESRVTSKGITYSGNVKVLVGFANLKIDRITLVKKKDGKCELISTD